MNKHQNHQSRSTASLIAVLILCYHVLPKSFAFQQSYSLSRSSSPTWRTLYQHSSSRPRRRHQLFWQAPLISSSLSSSSYTESNNFDPPIVNGHHEKPSSQHHQSDPIWKTTLGVHFLRLGSNLTPYHILDPMAASLMTSNSPCSLHKGLGIFKRALEKLASSRQEDLISSLLPTHNGNRILRLELELSHIVDPLAWLHAQQRRQQTSAIPQVYLKTESLEAAAFGAAYRHVRPSSISDSDDHRHSLWRLVQEQLPSNSLLYGGERFDTNTTHVGDEWKRFGQAMWILPAIELRHEQIITHASPSPQGDFISTSNTRSKHPSTVTLAIHLHRQGDEDDDSWAPAAKRALELLQMVSSRVSDQVPITTLPPVLSRESSYYDKDGNGWDGQELYEKGVMAALQEFENNNLEKVVLARRMDLRFGASVSALDIIKRWKYGGQEGGHLFYLHPGQVEDEEEDEDYDDETVPGTEFFGCTPERLFQIQRHTNMVVSEALAGTRPRGTTQQADEALSRDLCASTKDVEENMITGRYIQKAFSKLCELGWITFRNNGRDGFDRPDRELCVLDNDSRFFVRRLRHLQHICQRFEGVIQDVSNGIDVARFLMDRLHPTPAVAGFPSNGALDFIRLHESIGFDRGYYSGPFGYIGPKSADILVAIRSGLVSPSRRRSESKVSLYAGAGVVPGSTVHGEWAETSYKLEVVSSLFPQSPISLQSAPTPNVAWATAFLEELIRQGVTQFYVCPGSRSTPLVVALAKAVRSNVGVVRAISVHDERGAGFRAVGYARGANRPAAVITSSGTATANLYPSIMEAGVDGVPMLILTADRPYENRDTGANQAVDQVKAYSSSYIRWFRDILPPSDDVAVSVALSDASHAVNLARKLKGPVHLNIQFRENLAPDAGPIRNDNRAESITNFNGFRFIDCPGFQRWSTGGGRWSKDFTLDSCNEAALYDVARLISLSSRGIIVIGNIRQPTNEEGHESISHTTEAIAAFAQFVGFPIFAGVQAAALRFSSDAVIPFAEHLLKHPLVAENMKPDLILQIGAPLVSSDVANMITASMKNTESQVHHVLVHPRHPAERADPSFTVSLSISTEISTFLERLVAVFEKKQLQYLKCSDLSPLVLLGRILRDEMEQIIHKASETVTSKQGQGESLTEPQVILALSQSFPALKDDMSLFLSNSMPVRDAECFLYPFVSSTSRKRTFNQVGVNRGASGIDGIISSAAGFSEATQCPTTLLIGDLAALHDLNALHTLSRTSSQSSGSPLTTIVVNNDGGGIFSFLPVAKYGSDVSFEEFFGTATSSFSFGKGVDAFGLPFRQATTFTALQEIYRQATTFEQPSVIEAVVTSRDVNVAVHKEITKRAVEILNDVLVGEAKVEVNMKLPIKIYSRESFNSEPLDESKTSKTMVLLHGWMGGKSDWDDVGTRLGYTLPSTWHIVSVDLPGHGDAPSVRSSDTESIRCALGTVEKVSRIDSNTDFSVDQMATCILESLSRDYGLKIIDAIAGYSLGGRVALAMKRLCASSLKDEDHSLIRESTKIVLISASPGNVEETDTTSDDAKRTSKDERLAASIDSAFNRGYLLEAGSFDQMLTWSDFLRNWYSTSIWGNLPNERTQLYQTVLAKRWNMLARRGREMGKVIRESTPPRQSQVDWKFASSGSTLFVAGHLDAKYSHLGNVWSRNSNATRFIEIPQAGHGLLSEASAEVAELMSAFVEEDFALVNGLQAIEKSVEASRGDAFSSPMPEIGSYDVDAESLPSSQMKRTGEVGSLEFKPFSIRMGDANSKEQGVFGIGWGENARVSQSLKMKLRSGFILHLLSRDGGLVGIGEVSPLPGLHSESLVQVEEQLLVIQSRLRGQIDSRMLSFEADSILQMNGAIANFMSKLSVELGVPRFLPSIRSGIEMALLSLAAQVVGTPIDQAILEFSPRDNSSSTSPLSSGFLPLCGIITRAEASDSALRPNWLYQQNDAGIARFPSVKVKVGHQDSRQDIAALLRAQVLLGDHGALRADANRAWNAASAADFATSLEAVDFILERLEFVEEPLQRQDSAGREWSLQKQVEALEQLFDQTGIPYALDESLADLAEQVNFNFDKAATELMKVFYSGRRGCAALVLKPSLLGLEFSLRISRMGNKKLGIPSVISSSFDSGVGLSYTAFLAMSSDSGALNKSLKTFPHGLGTFNKLATDTISPPFANYVDANGMLNVASLGKALYGLSLDEIPNFATSYIQTNEKESTSTPLITPSPATSDERRISGAPGADYEATMSSHGRETTVVATLPLPFSADIASSRFTDLPQQPRWSPWLSCVAYLDAPGRETEWTLNVRGAKFSWRAISRLLEAPNKGIVWESISGLQHRGAVEFVPLSTNSCRMRVQMTIVVPRIIASLFQGASFFLEDFLQSKLLKWSMEMFRDVVKGDLALERGDVELGDALFGAVEGKASAIEATLSPSTIQDDERERDSIL